HLQRSPQPFRRPRVSRCSGAKEHRTRIFAQNLSTQIHQANAPEPVLPACCAPLRSTHTTRPANWPVFPDEKSDLLRLPSSFLRPATKRSQRRQDRNERRIEIPAIVFVATL